MAQVTATPPLARRSLFETSIDRIWRFFCSVRAAVYEIIALAIIVLIGTLRGSSVPQYLADAVPALQPLVKHWYDWDAFHSLLFAALLTLSAVAITICTLNRAPAIWQAIQHPTVTTTHGFLRRAEPSAELATGGSTAELAGQLTGALRARRYRVLTAEQDGAIHVYADKHRWAKLGTFPFHLALILVMVGGIVGARLGFRDQEFIVPVGESRPIGHGTGLTVRLDRFSDLYNEDGTAKSYASNVTVLKDGEPVKQGTISVNHPLAYGNTIIYQSSFGQTAEIKVTNSAGVILYQGAVDMGLFRAVDNPDAPAGKWLLPQAGVEIVLIGPADNPWAVPPTAKLNLRSGQMFIQAVPLNGRPGVMPPSQVVDLGQTAVLGDLRVQFLGEGRFALFQVASNPGIPIFILAAILMVGGLAITFYFPHRRVRAIVAPAPGGASARLAPLAKRDWSGQRDFHRLLDDLAARLGVTPRLRAPAPPRAAAVEPESIA